MAEKTTATTKDRILELLKIEVKMTVKELTGRLNITHMAVRKHLSILEKDALVYAKEIKQPMGRPLQIYSLTEKGERLFPKNYEGITVEFLHDINDLHGEESVHALFKKREQRLTKEYSTRTSAKKSAAGKITEIVTIQNEKGYMATARQIADDTFELVEHNCPILAIAKDFQIACNCETQLLKNVLKAEHISRTSCKSDGDDHCRFCIKF
ncbi:Predicted transcriptional regulator, ArsR family [Evansella caseinilytica]|uniref:Predicted transcriptional regulator, ArsR family n=1 Tax=Evansella caseinilytica TaxID=1503961 RepID=A0A1H3SD61_9BACI|nr:metalloregulator ArsR/SmtB family transcription factor [Evansella caseinilytica]SDZ35946.1 Predicted transcriptional regulator, ArsR family [Evansella caseinilytica]